MRVWFRIVCEERGEMGCLDKEFVFRYDGESSCSRRTWRTYVWITSRGNVEWSLFRVKFVF